MTSAALPDGWRRAPLAAHAIFKTGPFGSVLHRSGYTTDGVPVINPTQIVGGRVVPRAGATVSEAVARDLAEFRVCEGDVLLARRGEMGRCAVVGAREAGWLCGTGSMIVRCGEGLLPAYLQRVLSSPRGAAAIASTSVGTTIININQRILGQLEVPVPPLAEQRAISAILADAEFLIVARQRAIEKREALLRGAMQQLLTGRARLPGHAGPWRTRRLGEAAHIIKTGGRNNEDRVEHGAYPLFVRSQTTLRIDTYAYDCEAVLVPGEGGIGSIVHYINGKFDCHQRVYRISAFADDICGKFVYYIIKNGFHRHAARNSVKATVDSLRLSTFREFEFQAPSRGEQAAIAAVLSDMDAEIAALRRQCDKARMLARALADELLAGRTRVAQEGNN